MTRPIESVVVVGGGQGRLVDRRLLLPGLRVAAQDHRDRVRSGRNRTGSGVGEATVPTVRDTLAFCGLDDETNWMRDCGATFKSAVKFLGWKNPVDGKPHVYYHPFFSAPERLVVPFDRPMFPGSAKGSRPSTTGSRTTSAAILTPTARSATRCTTCASSRRRPAGSPARGCPTRVSATPTTSTRASSPSASAGSRRGAACSTCWRTSRARCSTSGASSTTSPPSRVSLSTGTSSSTARLSC